MGTDFNTNVSALTGKEQNTKPIKYAWKNIRWKCFGLPKQKCKKKKKSKTNRKDCPEFFKKNLFQNYVE